MPKPALPSGSSCPVRQVEALPCSSYRAASFASTSLPEAGARRCTAHTAGRSAALRKNASIIGAGPVDGHRDRGGRVDQVETRSTGAWHHRGTPGTLRCCRPCRRCPDGLSGLCAVKGHRIEGGGQPRRQAYPATGSESGGWSARRLPSPANMRVGLFGRAA